MMRTIARRISEETCTLPEIARELGVQQEALLERLFMMERLGFIARDGGCTGSARTEASSRRCIGCSCAACGEAVGGNIVHYALTEKGKRLAGTKK
ncbi:MAG: hypothetical protein PWP08_458 [Methanofollis sp.]|nr:hypothetical protein [Methanofollis sp.]